MTVLTENAPACQECIDHLRTIGQRLWSFGYLIGPDRPAGLSPGGYGDDGMVALGLVAQMTAELGAGTLTLLDARNRYAAAALIRQLIELEYLSWWMAEHPAQRHRWIRASADEHRVTFSPAALRKLSKGRFDRNEYHQHCAVGGHPHPSACVLLPCHEPALGEDDLVGDLRYHLEKIRRYIDKSDQAAGIAKNASERPDGLTS